MALAGLMMTAAAPIVAAGPLSDVQCIEQPSTNTVVPWCRDDNGSGSGDEGSSWICYEDIQEDPSPYYGEWAKADTCVRSTSTGCDFMAWGKVRGDYPANTYHWVFKIEIYTSGEVLTESWSGVFTDTDGLGPHEEDIPPSGTVRGELDTGDHMVVKSKITNVEFDGTPVESGGTAASVAYHGPSLNGCE